MASNEEMKHVGSSCPGYEPDDFGFKSYSSDAEPDYRSCTNCRNLKDGKCVKNLYDQVLAGLDQT
ncbi:hypothetical protein [Clostridium luticellarii]|jgi:hypothetical protein|uniref:Uncharacterized protein n=1 Tax=Clostridium luticellarii TaxID=1691940 RepID=A0A2T0BLX2_9CLOT|nr:hypothetical protein [Clostridium luticellarii]MCI1945911.1 hypothetical protein [Clostridium luticellarii]MCI1969273.1 hypothetical protein [Clostridium luticellarii]MCI1996197.1 hypothetical protein [Clostridium luticellarii]MCI2040576.1 hypothetical protein [Clostridium luticellarii]PRR84885.1 hypothetical protein CLLU_21540 [Clostridium luticellarii]